MKPWPEDPKAIDPDETAVLSREEARALVRDATEADPDDITRPDLDAIRSDDNFTYDEHEQLAHPQRGVAAVGVAVGIALLVVLLAGSAFRRCTDGARQGHSVEAPDR